MPDEDAEPRRRRLDHYADTILEVGTWPRLRIWIGSGRRQCLPGADPILPGKYQGHVVAEHHRTVVRVRMSNGPVRVSFRFVLS